MLSLKQRIRRLEKLRSPEYRLTDIAVIFHEVDKNPDDGKIYPTGQKTKMYGGCYDKRLRKYVGDPGQYGGVLHLCCSPKQFIGVESELPLIENSGGRGFGKSEGGRIWIKKKICEIPSGRGRVVSPTSDLTNLIWFKLLGPLLEVAPHWVLSVHLGGKVQRQEIVFANHHRLQFRSAHKPMSVRGAGVHYGLVDESQDVEQRAYEVFQPSVRLGDNPQIMHALTPDPGDSYKRHLKHVERGEDGTATLIHATSYDNIFLKEKHIEESIRGMSRRAFQIEVMGDWGEIARMKEEDRPPFAFQDFMDPKEHQVVWPVDGKDITASVLYDKTGVSGMMNLIGVDPNKAFPNYAVVYRIVTPKELHLRRRVVAINVIERKGHCGTLGDEMTRAGYTSDNSLIVIDASARYARSPNKPAAKLRKLGYKVLYASPGHARNPLVVDSVEDMLSHLAPVHGPPTLYFSMPQCEILWEALWNSVWRPSGRNLTDWDYKAPDGTVIAQNPHVVDAGRYPISRLFPATRMPTGTKAIYQAA